MSESIEKEKFFEHISINDFPSGPSHINQKALKVNLDEDSDGSVDNSEFSDEDQNKTINHEDVGCVRDDGGNADEEEDEK
ncbi:hypothetical protein MMC16_007871, partial [Acarospora aff. strigata]|nr:hypothetical protein [Acarospora aff. strigata]